MSTLSTHVLDTSLGKPAAGLSIRLEKQDAGAGWKEIAAAVTNHDGRAPDLFAKGATLAHGAYRITFDTAAYAKSQKTKSFYPYVQIVFELSADEHYHVPLLLSPFGYSTYRGS